MQPYYEQDGITIYHADCRDVLPSLCGNESTLVLTDPPYGINKAEWDDQFPTWWLEDAARIAPVVGVMPGVANILRLPHTVGRLTYRWTLAAHIVNGMTRGAIGYGNWIPCLVFASDEISLFQQASDAGRIVIGREPKPDHPSPKPLEAMRWFLSCLPGVVVIDPFMGSGTTLRAAKDMGLRGVGIEVDERYCEIAAKRLQQSVLPLGVL